MKLPNGRCRYGVAGDMFLTRIGYSIETMTTLRTPELLTNSCSSLSLFLWTPCRSD